MNVLPPERFNAQSADGSIALTYVVGKSAWVDIKESGKSKRYEWKAKPEYPSKIIVAPVTHSAYFIGGHGDAGVDLGRVVVYNLLDGTVQYQADLQ